MSTDWFEVLANSILTRFGIDPARRYGPNHGAPASMWLAFAVMVAVAVGLPILEVMVGK